MSYKFEQMSVLVVEDLQPMQNLLVNVLRYLGVKNISTASNGEAGYIQFQRHNPDIVLTDWEMEPVGGLQMIEWIRRDSMSVNRMVPVIIITGYASPTRVSQARDVGVTEFLVKPFTANELAKRIVHVINNPRDFVETRDFYGPDRRRREAKRGDGPDRRGHGRRA